MLLKIQDNEYILKYDINALAMLEEETGQPISDVLSEDEMSITKLRLLFYVGLKNKHPELTTTDVGDLMQKYITEHGDMEELSKLIMRAFEESSLTKKK